MLGLSDRLGRGQRRGRRGQSDRFPRRACVRARSGERVRERCELGAGWVASMCLKREATQIVLATQTMKPLLRGAPGTCLQTGRCQKSPQRQPQRRGPWEEVRPALVVRLPSSCPAPQQLQAGRTIICLPLDATSSFGCSASATTGGRAELSRSALVSLGSASAATWFTLIFTLFQKQTAAHERRRRDRSTTPS